MRVASVLAALVALSCSSGAGESPPPEFRSGLVLLHDQVVEVVRTHLWQSFVVTDVSVDRDSIVIVGFDATSSKYIGPTFDSEGVDGQDTWNSSSGTGASGTARILVSEDRGATWRSVPLSGPKSVLLDLNAWRVAHKHGGKAVLGVPSYTAHGDRLYGRMVLASLDLATGQWTPLDIPTPGDRVSRWQHVGDKVGFASFVRNDNDASGTFAWGIYDLATGQYVSYAAPHGSSACQARAFEFDGGSTFRAYCSQDRSDDVRICDRTLETATEGGSSEPWCTDFLLWPPGVANVWGTNYLEDMRPSDHGLVVPFSHDGHVWIAGKGLAKPMALGEGRLASATFTGFRRAFGDLIPTAPDDGVGNYPPPTALIEPSTAGGPPQRWDVRWSPCVRDEDCRSDSNHRNLLFLQPVSATEMFVVYDLRHDNHQWVLAGFEPLPSRTPVVDAAVYPDVLVPARPETLEMNDTERACAKLLACQPHRSAWFECMQRWRLWEDGDVDDQALAAFSALSPASCDAYPPHASMGGPAPSTRWTVPCPAPNGKFCEDGLMYTCQNGTSYFGEHCDRLNLGCDADGKECDRSASRDCMSFGFEAKAGGTRCLSDEVLLTCEWGELRAVSCPSLSLATCGLPDPADVTSTATCLP